MGEKSEDDEAALEDEWGGGCEYPTPVEEAGGSWVDERVGAVVYSGPAGIPRASETSEYEGDAESGPAEYGWWPPPS